MRASIPTLGPMLAGVLMLAAPAAAQAPTDLAIGARVCGSAQLLDETDADFQQRLRDEVVTPEWIWRAIDRMQGAPQAMEFTFQEVNGIRVLLANGGIDDHAHDKLTAALGAHKPVDEVWLNSPGGNSRVGVQMGQTLRAQGIITMVKAGYGCASACSTAFLGGLMRRVEEGAIYGVHMYSSELSGSGPALSQDLFNDIQWQGAMGATERIFYAQEMGVTRKWASIWSSTRPGCMTFMSQSELSATLVNNLID